MNTSPNLRAVGAGRGSRRAAAVSARFAGAALAALVSASLVAPGCKGEKASSSKAPATGEADPGPVAVKLQLNWVPEPEFGGFYAAVHERIYERAGLKVDIAAGGAGVQTWKLVATGKVPFAIASAGEVLRARLVDADVVAIFAVYQKNPQGLMVHADAGVSSLEEVFTSGKIERVAMEAGLPYVKYLEDEYGFDKVKVIQYGGNLSLFLQDKTMAQQCFVFAEPVSAEAQGVAVQTFSIADAGFDPYLAVVVTSDAYRKAHPRVVDDFARASREGWQAYLADAGPTNEYMITQGATMTVEAMKRAAELQTPYILAGDVSTDDIGTMTAARWQKLAEQLVALGEIAKVPDIASLFASPAPGSKSAPEPAPK